MGKFNDTLIINSTRMINKVGITINEIMFSIKEDATYLKNGDEKVQNTNELSNERPDYLDYDEVNKNLLEEYYAYSKEKETAYFSDAVKKLREVEVPILAYRNTLKEGAGLEAAQEALENILLVMDKDGTGVNITEEEFLDMNVKSDFEHMKKKSVQTAYEAETVVQQMAQAVVHEMNLINVAKLQMRIDETEKNKDIFKKNVKDLVKNDKVYPGSQPVNELWDDYSNIKGEREEIYQEYKDLNLGQSEIMILGETLKGLKEFGGKCKSPNKKKNSVEYDKMEHELDKLTEAIEKGEIPPTTEGKIAYVKALKEATEKYVKEKNSQIRLFPTGYRVGRLAMANRIAESCKTTLSQLESIAEIDKQMEKFKVEKIERSYKNYETFCDKLENTRRQYVEKHPTVSTTKEVPTIDDKIL